MSTATASEKTDLAKEIRDAFDAAAKSGQEAEPKPEEILDNLAEDLKNAIVKFVESMLSDDE